MENLPQGMKYAKLVTEGGKPYVEMRMENFETPVRIPVEDMPDIKLPQPKYEDMFYTVPMAKFEVFDELFYDKEKDEMHVYTNPFSQKRYKDLEEANNEIKYMARRQYEELGNLYRTYHEKEWEEGYVDEQDYIPSSHAPWETISDTPAQVTPVIAEEPEEAEEKVRKPLISQEEMDDIREKAKAVNDDIKAAAKKVGAVASDGAKAVSGWFARLWGMFRTYMTT